MRLFIAINFTEDVKNCLSEAVGKLEECSVSGNFTQRENLHMTLVFLGEVRDMMPAIHVMDRHLDKKTELTVSGLGSFRREQGDIYWAGVKENPMLKKYYRKLCAALKKEGFRIEDRQFRPHITLGRQVILRREPNILISDITMPVDSISLVKSERVNGRIRYTEVYVRDLHD